MKVLVAVNYCPDCYLGNPDFEQNKKKQKKFGAQFRDLVFSSYEIKASFQCAVWSGEST